MCAVITESHLNDSILDAEIHIPGYTPYRQDRIGRIQGGTIIYVKDEFASNVNIIYKHCNTVVECIALHIKPMNCVVVGIYRPPDCKSNEFNYVIDRLSQALDKVSAPIPDIHVMGDFNFPFMKWKYTSNINIPTLVSGNTLDEQNQAKHVLQFAEYHMLSQMICKPTRNNNILDLCFTNNIESYHEVNVHATSLSDHNIIDLVMRYSSEKRETPVQDEKRTGFRALNFFSEETNWSKLDKDIKSVNWDDMLTELSPSDTLNSIIEKVINLCEASVPISKKTIPRKHHIPKQNRILMRRKKRINQRLTRNNVTENSRLKLNQEKFSIENKLKTIHMETRLNEEKKATAAIKQNSKYFFTYAKRHSNTQSSIGPLTDSEGNITTDPKTICELLRTQYESVFSPPLSHKKVNNPTQFFATDIRDNNMNILSDIEFSESDLIYAMKEIKSDAAPGPDDFPAILLNKCAASLARPLYIFWRKSIDSGNIPSILKQALITPIFKGGGLSKGTAKNYRPIALTSHLIKTFEKVIRKNMVQFLERTGAMNVNQHGFRNGRSCLSQLLAHYDFILHKLESGHNVDVIYLDFAKAFDKVDHGVLLHKLRCLGIKGKLGEWIYSFLTNRSQHVTANRSRSSRSMVTSGVPQGSVLGPLLFLVHIFDIDEHALHAFMSSFADDTRAAGAIANIEDHNKLQHDLDSVYTWSANNNMKFNNDKFEHMTYGYNECLKSIPYTAADGKNIPTANKVKDLGIYMSSNASFKEHIQTISAEATRMANWVLRTFITREPSVMLFLWKQLVLSRLEVGCPLWNPLNKGNIQSLEVVQKTFTRRLSRMEGLDYWQRLEKLKLYSLQRRRERYDIMYIWKIIEGKVPNISPVSNRQIRTYNHIRNGRMCIIPEPLRTARMQVKTLINSSFVVRAVKLFNAVPKDIREMSNCEIDTFKSALDTYIRTLPDKPALPGYYTATESNSLLHVIPYVERMRFMMPRIISSPPRDAMD